MARSLEMNAFLGHQTRSGNTGQFLRGWKKKNPPVINTVLHTGTPIVAMWQHGLPRIFEQKDEKTGNTRRRVFGGSFNCLEEESVLVKQYRRDRSTGERVLPPVVCPMCRLLEALRQAYEDGDIGFTDPVFRWVGDDPNETQDLTLGGMLNMYGSDRLTDEEKAAIKASNISLRDAWQENSWAKCNYLFTVVDYDAPESGVQLAIETTALGDAVKDCIHAQLKAYGEKDGNPMLNPYVIAWEHHPNAKEFTKRYKAIAMPRFEITHQIEELISGEPPDITNVVKPGNITKLRAELEARCVLKDKSVIPWDDIWGPAERAGYGDDDTGAKAAENEAQEAVDDMANKRRRASAQVPAEVKAEPAPEPTPGPAATGRRRKKVEPEPEPPPPPPAVNMIPCDECGKPMPETATTCPHCGAEYELEDEPAPPPPPAPKAGRKIAF